MSNKLKVLHVALEKQHYDLAAHAIVYGMVKVKVQENQKKNGKKGSPKRQSERP